MPEPTLEEARAAMIAKRFGGNVNGAKTADGSRRKKKSVHKTGAGIIYISNICILNIDLQI